MLKPIQNRNERWGAPEETFGSTILAARKRKRKTQEQLIGENPTLFSDRRDPRQVLSDLEQDRLTPSDFLNFVSTIAVALDLDEAMLEALAKDDAKTIRRRELSEADRKFEYAIYRARRERD